MKVNLLLFSSASDLAGFKEKSIEVNPGASIEQVVKYLEGNNSEFLQWKPYLRYAVNREFVETSHALNDGDEVAVIPPVSGG